MSVLNYDTINNLIIVKDNVVYKIWNPEHEVNNFEPMIKYHVKDIFGDNAEYFEKQKLRTLADHRSIPDGFVVDFERKKWYIVELKLLCEDAIKRIPGQIVDYKNAVKNRSTRWKIYKAIRSITNVDFLDDLINDSEPEIIVIIDRLDGRLGKKFIEKVKGTESKIKIIEFKTFARDGVDPRMVHIHQFIPLYQIKPPVQYEKNKVDEIVEPIEHSTPLKNYIVNTNVKYRPEAYKEMIQEGKVSAYGDNKTRVDKIKIGDRVFLYHSGVGICAVGQAIDEVEEKDYLGIKSDEHYIPCMFKLIIDPIKNKEKALTAKEIKKILNREISFLHTIFSINDEESYIIEEIFIKKATS